MRITIRVLGCGTDGPSPSKGGSTAAQCMQLPQARPAPTPGMSGVHTTQDTVGMPGGNRQDNALGRFTGAFLAHDVKLPRKLTKYVK